MKHITETDSCCLQDDLVWESFELDRLKIVGLFVRASIYRDRDCYIQGLQLWAEKSPNDALAYDYAILEMLQRVLQLSPDSYLAIIDDFLEAREKYADELDHQRLVTLESDGMRPHYTKMWEVGV